MAREPRGLGKGLSALLGEAAPVADNMRKPIGYVNKEIAGNKPKGEAGDILRIPADMIEANPYQPRMAFDQEELDELTASIKVLGLIQPITVRRISEDKYQIISGERRFRACRQAGMTMIPAYIRDASDQGMLEMAIVENIQRSNLDPIETALSYQRLIDECCLTQEEMADRIGKKRTSVTNTLRLLKLPAKLQHDLKVGVLSVGHAKVILGVNDPAVQEQLCDVVIAKGLNVRQLEELVKKLLAGESLPEKKKSQPKPLTENYTKIADRISKFFAKEIEMKRSSAGKGSMTIKFESDEEVSRFLQALENADI